jgi:predicted RNA-binding protein YlqC (UPF0109 family)
MDRPRPTVSLKEFVEHVVGRIIDHPEELLVEVVEGDRAIVIETRVAPIDAGRVIGREGRTINALRTLVMAMAARGGKRAVLDVVEIPRLDAAERAERGERPERGERHER